MPVRSFALRSDACCICKKGVHSTTATTTDPEAPEMIQPPEGSWFGVVQDESGRAELVACCSRECLLKLLREES